MVRHVQRLILRAGTTMAVAAALGTLGGAAQAAGSYAPSTASAEVAAKASARALLLDRTDRLIVKYKGTTPTTTASGVAAPRALDRAMLDARLSAAQSAASSFGVKLSLVRQTGLGSHVLKLDRALSVVEAARLADSLKASDTEIEYAEADRLVHPTFTPNDSLFFSQWDLLEGPGGIRARAGWDLAPTRGSGIVVAVIDTGLRPHADLVGQTVPGYDMITLTSVSADGNGRDPDATDPGDFVTANQCGVGAPAENSSWHGTHVAGTIAARTNNATGVAGIAHAAKIQPVRVLGKCGGYNSDVADGIIWASGGAVPGLPANPNRARVLNLSLGGGGACSTTFQNAINGARSRGSVVVVAAGNSASDAAGEQPSSCAGVIAVAANGPSGNAAYYSNYGTKVSLTAPGGDMSTGTAAGVLSTLNAGATTPAGDTYRYYQGTSMATPHVAGVAALMLSARPTYSPDLVAQILRNSARVFPSPCYRCGDGILDAQLAMRTATGPWIPTIAEVEGNNARTSANIVTAPRIVAAGIDAVDQDWYGIDVPAGATIGALLLPASNTDLDLYAYNAAGTLLASSIAGGATSDVINWRNATTATQRLYLQVRLYAGPATPYRLKLRY